MTNDCFLSAKQMIYSSHSFSRQQLLRQQFVVLYVTMSKTFSLKKKIGLPTCDDIKMEERGWRGEGDHCMTPLLIVCLDMMRI